MFVMLYEVLFDASTMVQLF